MEIKQQFLNYQQAIEENKRETNKIWKQMKMKPQLKTYGMQQKQF